MDCTRWIDYIEEYYSIVGDISSNTYYVCLIHRLMNRLYGLICIDGLY